jgi:Na+-translocating ferredoxin:NAD+ oxidoreductase subunit C
MPTPIPPLLTIPIGNAQAGTITSFVSVGETVLKYQKLAIFEHSAFNSTAVPVHAPTSGIISAIEPASVADPSQPEQICIKLETDNQDAALAIDIEADYSTLKSTELIQIIRDSGILGMGGAGFPSAEKLDRAMAYDIQLLIINAVECEPYITADEALIRERAKEVLLGADILRLAYSAQRCLIAIEDNKPDAIQALREAAKQSSSKAQRHEIISVASKYPAGSEKQLIHCLTGIEIPSGEHPPSSGIAMQNVGTAHAVYEAVVSGRPCISRITTVCGQSLKTPKNFEVLIGTATEFLFELSGAENNSITKRVVGGSLRGHELKDATAVVAKTSNCLIAASTEDIAEKPAELACIRCGFCADVCPAKLLPQQLLAFSRTNNSEQLESHGLFDCIECGACDYVCPSHIPLLSSYQKSKAAIQSNQHSMQRSQYWQQRFQFHQYRIKKDKDKMQESKVGSHTAENSEPSTAETLTKNDAEEIFSKQEASREIAAAVARVKARRIQTAQNNSPSKGKSE